MKRNILILVCLGMLLALPSLTIADCADVGWFGSFSVTDNTVTLYAWSMPVVKFDVQACDIRPTSKIQLIKNYICDGDEILIDGQTCVILDLKSTINH